MSLLHKANKLTAAFAACICVLFTACFTGVESTPRINASDVRNQRADVKRPEADFLTSISPARPAYWKPGRRYLVANDRISLIFTSESDSPSFLSGHTMTFAGFSPARSLTGDDATDIIFTSDDNRRLIYRVPSLDATRLDTLKVLDVPFAIDLDIVERVDSIMRGKNFFIRTPAWYRTDTRTEVQGLRHVEVRVDSVVPGNENFPLGVCFTLTDPTLASQAMPDGKDRMVFMSLGNAANATRNFDVLFAFADPRRQYPEIKDEIWELITRSKVQEGMTRDECRLALGAPPSLERIPTPSGIAERWRYSDGIYLFFEDGFLTRYRL